MPKNQTHLIPPDTIFCLTTQINEEFYATITAKPEGKGVEPIIVIAGPFATKEEATDHNGKWLELGIRRRQLTLVNMNRVPTEVRRLINDQIRRGWRQGDLERLRSWKGGDDLIISLAPKN